MSTRIRERGQLKMAHILMKQQNEAKRSFQLQYPDQRRVLVVKLGKYIYIYIYIYKLLLSSVLLGFSRHPRCRRSTSCFHPQSSLLFSCHLPPRRSTTCSHPQSGLKQGLKKQLFHLSAVAFTALTHHNLRAGALEARDKR